MFGHQDDHQGQDSGNDEAAMDALAAEITPADGTQQSDGENVPQPSLDTSGANDQSPTQDDSSIKDAISPAGGYPKPPSQRVHLAPVGQADDNSGDAGQDEEKKQEDSADADKDKDTKPKSDDQNAGSEDLLGLTTDDLAKDDLAALKIQALDELYPLIDKLDLPPEERFRTLMMMLQASDNQELVKAAYEAAHGIEDEKAKAQALLDIVNEINYFTHQPEI